MATAAERLCGKVCGGSLLLVGGTCSDAATKLLNRGVFMDAGISVKAEIRTRVCVVSGANGCSFVTVKCHVPQAFAKLLAQSGSITGVFIFMVTSCPQMKISVVIICTV